MGFIVSFSVELVVLLLVFGFLLIVVRLRKLATMEKNNNNFSTQDSFFTSKLFVSDLYIIVRAPRLPINSQFTRTRL